MIEVLSQNTWTDGVAIYCSGKDCKKEKAKREYQIHSFGHVNSE